MPAGCLSRRSHTWLATGNAVRAIERAVLHAGWKVGGSYPAGVTLTSAQLDTLEALCAVEATVGRWDTEQPSSLDLSHGPALSDLWRTDLRVRRSQALDRSSLGR